LITRDLEDKNLNDYHWSWMDFRNLWMCKIVIFMWILDINSTSSHITFSEIPPKINKFIESQISNITNHSKRRNNWYYCG